MELRKPDNYYGACMATEPPLPFGLLGGGGGDSNNKHLFSATASQSTPRYRQFTILKSDIVIFKTLSIVYSNNSQPKSMPR
jgi:hypothetical protein